MEIDHQLLEELFSAVGAHLEAAGAPTTVVVVGGAWVRDQDVGPEFKSFVDEASERLRRAVEED